MDKDRLFASDAAHLVDFRFDEETVRVFPDMIRRSVPGYETIVSLIGGIAAVYFQPGTRVYDLGCSLGACMLSVSQRISDPAATYIGIDSSGEMLEKCRQVLSGKIPDNRVELLEQKVERVEIQAASVVILNFTMQFVDPGNRLALLEGIYEGLVPGGVLILSEKIDFEDPRESELQEQLHQEFKRANGYSDLEISRKRTALEKVMNIDTELAHRERLSKAGFENPTKWFQCLNFASFIAVK